ncbi:ParA family protein [Cupriavidus necator]|uniref:ParA family protein n=1 Tax=Cupriavidus necator TaxID=106590 RepID=UPI003ED0BE41
MQTRKTQSSPKTKIIVVINQKGGTGKTTLSFHLAHAGLEGAQSKVLCLDMDSQGTLSQYLTDNLDVTSIVQGGVGDLFEGAPAQPQKTTHPRIDLLHGHRELDRYDFDETAEERAYSGEMSDLLRSLGYDYIVIDVPPAVGLRHLSPLRWADIVVIPLEPSMAAITGFQNVLGVMDESISAANPKVKWVGVMNRANMRVKAHREKDAWMRETYGNRILATLSTRAAVAEAMEESPARPVWSHGGAPKELRDQWREVCAEIVGR